MPLYYHGGLSRWLSIQNKLWQDTPKKIKNKEDTHPLNTPPMNNTHHTDTNTQ